MTYLFLVEGVIEGKLMVLYVLGQPINLVFGLVNLDLGIGAGYGVDLSILLLFFENGPFSNAD